MSHHCHKWQALTVLFWIRDVFCMHHLKVLGLYHISKHAFWRHFDKGKRCSGSPGPGVGPGPNVTAAGAMLAMMRALARSMLAATIVVCCAGDETRVGLRVHAVARGRGAVVATTS